jgi:hypothetical protein
MALPKPQTPLLFSPEPLPHSGDFGVGTLTQANNKLWDQRPLQVRSPTSNGLLEQSTATNKHAIYQRKSSTAISTLRQALIVRLEGAPVLSGC